MPFPGATGEFRGEPQLNLLRSIRRNSSTEVVRIAVKSASPEMLMPDQIGRSSPFRRAVGRLIAGKQINPVRSRSVSVVLLDVPREELAEVKEAIKTSHAIKKHDRPNIF